MYSTGVDAHSFCKYLELLMELTFPSYLLEHQLPTAESAKYNMTALPVHVNMIS